MIAEVLLPLIRRAILDLLLDTGGESNDDVITVLLAEIGHRVARSDVAGQLRWLAEKGYASVEEVGPFLVARTTSDGRDIAMGRMRVDGVYRHKTGE